MLDGSDTAPIEAAAAGIGMPLDILRIQDGNAARIYQKPLILVRPDHHVAWRGDALPNPTDLGAWRTEAVIDTCAALLDKVRGAD